MNNMTQFTENANRPGDKSRVLIIDDEPDIVTYLKLLLEENGYAADAAASAEEGLALVAERPPDLILLDIMMPRMTGLAFYRRGSRDSRRRKGDCIERGSWLVARGSEKTKQRRNQRLTEK